MRACIHTRCKTKTSTMGTLLVFLFFIASAVSIPDHSFLRMKREAVKKSTEEIIREVLEHFKQEDPLGIPGIPLQDPMDIPDFQGAFSIVKIQFTKAQVLKLTKFRIKRVHVDVANLKVSLSMHIPQLVVTGRYAMSNFFSTQRGDFVVFLKDVYVSGDARLRVEEGGYFQIDNVNMDMTFQEINMKFQDLGFLGSIFQGIINAVGPFIFDSIKPTILGSIDTSLKTEANAELKKFGLNFSPQTPPIDSVIGDARSFIQKSNLDPYVIPDRQFSSLGINFKLTQGKLHGLSTIHRVGNITITVVDNVVSVHVNMGTKELTGKAGYETQFLWWTVGGDVTFTVEYLHVGVTVSQPLNLDKNATVEAVDVEVGPVDVHTTGESVIDSFLDYGVDAVSFALRDLLTCIAEEPIREILETEINKIDLQHTIISAL
ncbi:unnamed protein product [Darwinula stevensoni]|uniref:Uncharacterized protein n=1 Tax=Darwinula stevensoni TaxID=69355 RepID=A0A7R9ACX9_9CRUS|nr:unnamed protein product [Darwinula stevensoni]CAG0900804.1 unnamed protein product [Darwinula stevensoni]